MWCELLASEIDDDPTVMCYNVCPEYKKSEMLPDNGAVFHVIGDK